MQDEGESEQLQDSVAIRMFTLCDHAAVPPDGKIYINGGGVHQLYVSNTQGSLRALFLMVRLAIPWHMLGEQHTVKIRALDLDRRPIGQIDPLITTPFELGRPAGHRPGDESAINICAELNGLLVSPPMTIHFHLLVDDESFGSLPLKVLQLP
jgi:hypothetical protein